MMCNCCVNMSWSRIWRGQVVHVARISRYWAMSPSGSQASQLARRMQENAAW